MQLVEERRASLLGTLRLLRLAADVHGAHALGDAGDIGSSRPGLAGPGSGISLIGSLVAAKGRSLRTGGLLRPVRSCLGELLEALGAGLLLLLLLLRGVGGRVSSVGGGGLGADGGTVGLGDGLAAGHGIGAAADLEGLGGVSSLLLLVSGGVGLGSGLLVVGLLRLLVALGGERAVAIARRRRGRHDGGKTVGWEGKLRSQPKAMVGGC